MRKEDPIKYNLKLQTIEIIKRIFLSENTTFKSAIKKVYNIAKKKHINTGFKMLSFDSFYNSVYVFMYKLNVQNFVTIEKSTKYTNQNQ
jgi:hypothetical protein